MYLDATRDYGKGGTFPRFNGFTDWVLHAFKIASGGEQESRPAVTRTVPVFGDLLTAVRNLSSATIAMQFCGGAIGPELRKPHRVHTCLRGAHDPS